MQCPKCGHEMDALEHAREQGYIPVPTIDLLAAKLAHIYKGQSIRMKDAQALRDALLEVNHE